MRLLRRFTFGVLLGAAIGAAVLGFLAASWWIRIAALGVVVVAIVLVLVSSGGMGAPPDEVEYRGWDDTHKKREATAPSAPATRPVEPAAAGAARREVPYWLQVVGTASGIATGVAGVVVALLVD